jgi:DNA invertase Pin-like site-specific DNA recombinase
MATTTTFPARSSAPRSTPQRASRNRADSRTGTGTVVPLFQASRNVVPNQIVGYVRVSKVSQSTEQQVDALRAIGVSVIFADEGVSGAQRDRKGLDAALAALRPGDALAVVALDRLGRDLSNLVRIVAGLQERGVHLRSLRESIDTTTAAGRMVFGVMAALAEYELAMIKERTALRLGAMKRRGEHIGRKPKLTPSQVEVARRELDAGTSSAQTIARGFKVGRSTLYRALAVAVAQ